ncbi:DUF6882 domain-containing protein [Brevibacterium salitolerans]|uniref:Uncharacterized protein n=1 Tax=Brevibacterium salitolerans TaxID=1403566 RepID=A0ABN2WRY5_9MICO
MSDSLQSLVDRAVFFSTEVQHHFGRLIAGAEFDIDFSAAPRLRFTLPAPEAGGSAGTSKKPGAGKAGGAGQAAGTSGTAPAERQELELRPHMIGSDVRRPREATWHWGWTNDSGFPDPVVALSHRVREYGTAHGIAELTAEELPLDADALPTRLTLAAKLVTGAWAHYPAQAGGGTTVWVLVDDARLALGEPELKKVVRAIASGITDMEISDHRAALESYFRLRGLRTVALPEDGIRLLCADGSADITFDEQGRIATCQAAQPLAGEAAEQFAEARAPETAAVFGAVEVPEEVPGAPAQTAPEAPAAPPAEAPAAQPAPAPAATSVPAAETAPPAADAEGAVPAEEPVVPAAQAPAPEDEGAQPADAPRPVQTPAAEPAQAEPATGPDRADQDESRQDDGQQSGRQERKGFFKRLFGR